MRLLHLLSDHRWTGPADPVVNLVCALRDRGHDVTFACSKGEPSEGGSRVAREAAAKGLPTIDGLTLSRRRLAGPPLTDLAALVRAIRSRQIDVVHTHLSHDHTLGAFAAKLSGRSPLVIRTNHKGRALPSTLATRALFRRMTDGYLGFSPAAARADAASFHLPPHRVFLTNPAVDLDRFDPAQLTPAPRQELGLGPDIVLGGIVARMQPHRRYDVLLEAIRIASRRAPSLRFVMLGRGGRAEQVVHRPVAEMGLQNVVLLPGYRKDDYVDFLGALDFKVFLVPGSDGTCRAAREAMALGKPVIAARRGMLPEMIDDGVTGLVVDDTAENLAEAMVRLVEDHALRHRLGDAARRHAVDHFRIERQAADVESMYRALLEARARHVAAPARI